ncbi:tRNA (uracil(54)-C(5))-methyltransferase -B [Halocaridina rubra]|uniref:tRNA (uracil(54)-C(5))-methyltransferase n=1 Tax=Halocaridina rubra TaxID=373956 RepID=A0AAN9FUZ2_HALRR
MHWLSKALWSYMHPQKLMCRGLRKNPNRSSLDHGIDSSASAMRVTIPALQTPLTEEDLVLLALDKSLEVKDVKPKPKKKKNVPLKKLIQPEVNPPLTEPITAETQYERLAQVVTPLYQASYTTQLKMKTTKALEVLKTLSRRMTENRCLFEKDKKGLACHLEPVRPSPDILAYRNKDEFGIHYGVDGNPKTVGFFVGKPTDPLMTCVPATHLINVKESHKLIAQRFQTFIRQSTHEACLKFDLGGIWRNLLVRSTRSDERMATVYIHPQDLIEDEILEIMSDLEAFFFHGEGSDCQLDSLYLQACKNTRCSREQAPYRLIKGKEHILETLEGLSFSISPDSFFQINTGGAEELYRVVREVAEVSSLTTLLDVCCGTGAISIVMSPFVRGSVGIDVISAAVEDANKNAFANKISNTEFIAGKAEMVLPQLTEELSQCTDVVAIMNPARAGLKPEVIQAIKQCEAITKLMYITCKPEGMAMENFMQLASNKVKGSSKKKTVPFIPKYAVPIDMFPHTHHTELVVLFERAFL